MHESQGSHGAGPVPPFAPVAIQRGCVPGGPQLVRSAWSAPKDHPTAPATADASGEITYEPDPLFDVSGLRVVVTGSTSGIGFMIASGFASRGASVLVTSRKAEKVKRAVDELVLCGANGEIWGIPSDLSSEEGAATLARSVAGRWSHIDVLVNNAGATWGAAMDEHDTSSWRRVLDLNVEGVFHTTRCFVPLLQESRARAGRVINIGSVDGLRPPTLETYSYSASKAAVHQLTRHLARRLAPKVLVNCIAPGPFPSRMMAATLRDFGPEIERSNPLGRVGTANDIQGAALLLASRAGAYITGSILAVDGGLASIGGAA